MGVGEEPPDPGLCLVPGPLGAAAVLEGGGAGVPYFLGRRVPFGGEGTRVGPCPPGSRGRSSHWHRRDRLEEGPPIPERWSTRSTATASACCGLERIVG